MKDLFEAAFVSNPVFEFLVSVLTGYPLVMIAVGVVVALFGYDVLRSRRHDPMGQIQPAAFIIVLGVLISLASLVALLVTA